MLITRQKTEEAGVDVVSILSSSFRTTLEGLVGPLEHQAGALKIAAGRAGKLDE